MEKQIAKAGNEEQKERLHVKKEWKADREASLKEHTSFLDMTAGMGVNNKGTCILCKSPNCRHLYMKENLLGHNLCCADGCRSHEVNYGCDVSMYVQCSRFLCSSHLPAHVQKCREEDDESLKRYHRSSWEKFEDFREERLSLDVGKVLR